MLKEMEFDASPYHSGERAIQERLGLRERIEQQGRRMIQSDLPEVFRAHLESLPFVVVGSLDPAGRPWASILSGVPGFMFSPDPLSVRIRARPSPGDPLAATLTPGSALGLLGIQLPTRRRVRVNGRLAASGPGWLELAVDQSFGNCPKYITSRAPQPRQLTAAGPVGTEGSQLSAAGLAMISASDTFFIASGSAPAPSRDDAREGVDVSHRGGVPGFVEVASESGASVLTIPDYAGNNAFNTLGNLLRHPRAGLLFPDFVSGDLLLLTGTTELVWSGPELARFPGAQRLLRVRVEAGVHLPAALPFHWSAPLASPQHAALAARR
jgi:predicted pyridoxine 5'-phosphate oxidase superfamily flavin-nucleotide-binding protein